MRLLITPADTAFSRCVRERAEWRCERCGVEHPPPTQALHCSHYFGRGNWGTRFSPSNAAALCFGCHRRLGSSPDEHQAWQLERLGTAEIDRLRALASAPAYGIRKHIKAIARHYRDEFGRMQQQRIAGVTGRLEFSAWSAA